MDCNTSLLILDFQKDFKLFLLLSVNILWHRCLAHPSTSIFSKITPVLPKITLDCAICHFYKSSKLPFKSLVPQTTQTFEIVHSDV